MVTNTINNIRMWKWIILRNHKSMIQIVIRAFLSREIVLESQYGYRQRRFDQNYYWNNWCRKSVYSLVDNSSSLSCLYTCSFRYLHILLSLIMLNVSIAKIFHNYDLFSKMFITIVPNISSFFDFRADCCSVEFNVECEW